MSKLNLATLSNSIADPVTLVNQNLVALSGALFFANPTLISALPTTPVVGTIYLVTAAATSPLTPGDVLLYLAATATGYTTFTPLDGAIAGNYIRSTTGSIGTWTATSGGGGGTGDMLKSVYDINLNGIVDNSEKLGGQLPSYYLNRANQTGAVTGGGLSPWSVKTANYTALMGDRLRYALTVDTIITLPAAPNLTDSEVWIQRTEITTNKLIINPNGNLIDGQTGKDALFNPTDFRAVERLSWAGGTIGYLSQEGRLTYQTHTTTGVGTNLTYVSDNDTNGLFYYLGSNNLTSVFGNPQVNGTILGQFSSVLAGSVQLLSNRIDDEFYTNNSPNSWVAFSIVGTLSISVSKYTIRTRPANTSQMLRSWVLEGTNTVGTFDVASINAATWTTIDTRNNDATLTTVSQSYTLTANGATTPFKYLRFRQTGLNATGADYLVLNELEFYGVLA